MNEWPQSRSNGAEHARFILCSDSRSIKRVVESKQFDSRRIVECIQRLGEDRDDIVNVRDQPPDASKRDQPNCVLTIEVVPEDNWHRRCEQERDTEQEVSDSGSRI